MLDLGIEAPAPNKITIEEIHIHIIMPMAAPREP